MDNAELKKTYDEAHKGGFFSYSSFPEQLMILGSMVWDGLTVLEIGCGTGELAATIAGAGAKRVSAIDYSEVAITRAKEAFKLDNLYFATTEIKKSLGKFDAVILCGTLEHLDKPFETLKQIVDHNMNPTGSIIVSVPGHINPRGIIWLTLKMLTGAVMSKTDQHELLPGDFENFCNENNLGGAKASAFPTLGYGKDMYSDLAQRLPLALAEVGINVDAEVVGQYLARLKEIVRHYTPNDVSGGALLYKMVKMPPQQTTPPIMPLSKH